MEANVEEEARATICARAPTGPPTLNDFDLKLGCTTPLPPARTSCSQCGKKKQWYCPECLLPCNVEGVQFPRIRMPLKLHVLRGREEKAVTSKATGNHAAVVAPDDTAIHHLPDFPSFPDPSRVLLLFPSPTSKLVSELPDLDAFDSVLVVDTTWQKIGGVMQLPELAAPFQHVAISRYSSMFWRHQPVGPQCVSTIEAVYFLMREWVAEKERRAAAAGAASNGSPSTGSASAASSSAHSLTASDIASVPAWDPHNVLYDGHLDPLVLLFMETYRVIQSDYTKGKHTGKDFTSRHRPGYIQGGGDAASSSAAVALKALEDGGEACEDDDNNEDRLSLSNDDAAAADSQPPPKRTRAGSKSSEDGSAPGASASSGTTASAGPGHSRQVRPDRIRGAWAIRSDVMDAPAREWSHQRMARYVANTAPLLREAAAAGGAGAAAAAALSEDGGDTGTRAAAAAASLTETGMASSSALSAAAFQRVQELQRQEYAVGYPRAPRTT